MVYTNFDINAADDNELYLYKRLRAIHPGSGGGGITVHTVTRNELINIINASGIKAGDWYKITNATAIGNVDNAPSGIPLIVVGITATTVSTTATSPSYLQDDINYNLDDDIITYRFDTENNITQFCDWRNGLGFQCSGVMYNVFFGKGTVGQAYYGATVHDVTTGENCTININVDDDGGYMQYVVMGNDNYLKVQDYCSYSTFGNGNEFTALFGMQKCDIGNLNTFSENFITNTGALTMQNCTIGNNNEWDGYANHMNNVFIGNNNYIDSSNGDPIYVSIGRSRIGNSNYIQPKTSLYNIAMENNNTIFPFGVNQDVDNLIFGSNCELYFYGAEYCTFGNYVNGNIGTDGETNTYIYNCTVGNQFNFDCGAAYDIYDCTFGNDSSIYCSAGEIGYCTIGNSSYVSCQNGNMMKVNVGDSSWVQSATYMNNVYIGQGSTVNFSTYANNFRLGMGNEIDFQSDVNYSSVGDNNGFSIGYLIQSTIGNQVNFNNFFINGGIENSTIGSLTTFATDYTQTNGCIIHNSQVGHNNYIEYNNQNHPIYIDGITIGNNNELYTVWSGVHSYFPLNCGDSNNVGGFNLVQDTTFDNTPCVMGNYNIITDSVSTIGSRIGSYCQLTTSGQSITWSDIGNHVILTVQNGIQNSSIGSNTYGTATQILETTIGNNNTINLNDVLTYSLIGNGNILTTQISGIENSTIGNNCNINCANIIGSTIGNNCTGTVDDKIEYSIMANYINFPNMAIVSYCNFTQSNTDLSTTGLGTLTYMNWNPNLVPTTTQVISVKINDGGNTYALPVGGGSIVIDGTTLSGNDTLTMTIDSTGVLEGTEIELYYIGIAYTVTITLTDSNGTPVAFVTPTFPFIMSNADSIKFKLSKINGVWALISYYQY